MTAVIASDGQELGQAIEEGSAVLVEFWAPWCVQCKAMSAVIERLAESVADQARVLTVNVEEHPAVAEHHQVQTLPALLLFRDGRLQLRLDGFRRLPAIMEQIRAEL